MRAICPAHPIPINLAILRQLLVKNTDYEATDNIIFTSLLDPNSLLNTLFSNTRLCRHEMLRITEFGYNLQMMSGKDM
jgi:hypothetical protein